MSRNRELIEKSALRAPYAQRAAGGSNGLVCNTQNAPSIPYDWAADNTSEERWLNAAGTDSVRALSVNPANQVMIAEGMATAPRKEAKLYIQDNASCVSQGFFLVNTGERYRVTSISYIHTTQASVAAIGYVEKAGAGVAVGSGTSLMSGTLNLNTIVNATATNATLSTTNTGDSDNPDLILNPGDQLNFIISATPTSLAGICVTVTLAPLGTSVKTVSYAINANADMVQAQYFFVANRPYVVSAVSMRWGTKSSVTGLKLTITKDTGTTAPGGGTTLLTDNTNAGPLVTQTANTAYAGTLTATAATIRLAQGDRLAIKFSGATLTALAGLVVTISLQETAAERIEKSWYLDHVPGATDLVGLAAIAFWTADRDYEILDIRENHNVLGTDGGAVTIGVGVASGTTAASSATIIQTDTSSAGFSIKATARTTQVGTLAVLGNRFLLAGDRLCMVPAGVFTAAAGVVLTVALQPR